MLNEKNIHDEKISESLDLVDMAGSRAVEMVKQLLSLSRRHELSCVPLDLNLSLRNVMKICENSFDKSVILSAAYAPGAAMIEGDPALTEQVFLNLCVNAAQAMTIMRKEGEVPGGKLSVSIRAVDGGSVFFSRHPEAEAIPYWGIMFSDTGVGMDEQIITRIFDPFFTTKQHRGSGLGLAMVYTTVRQHCGFVDVNSEPGAGATFTVYFPRLTNAEKCPAVQEPREIVKGTGRVLIIDDEALPRMTASDMLSECGYEVLVSESGDKGVSLFLKSDRIDLVLLDLAMPGMSGKEVYSALAAIRPDVKVLLSSGFSQDPRIEEVRALGVRGFIQKPYTMADLSKEVYRILHE